MVYKEFLDLRDELRSGDNRRLKTIFEAYSSHCIRKLLYDYKCSHEDAEDIYTDSILNLRDKVVSGKLEAITDIKGYLYATCKNMWLARFQKEKRLNNAAFELYAHQATYELDQEDFLEYRQKIIRLTEEGLSGLSEKCRQMLKAFYFDRLDMEEIAEKMSFANANVAKVSKARCFQKLIESIKMLENQNKNSNVTK